jgi:Protein of unknown function (DUF3014)
VNTRSRAGSRRTVMYGAIAVVVAGLVGAAGWYWWPRTPPSLPERPAAAPAEPPVAATPPPVAIAPPASAPVALPEPPVERPLAAATLADAVVELLGRPAVLKFVQTDDLPRRFVATIDNLGRSHAPSQLWPVNPTAGRFKTIQRNGVTIVDPDNAQRYVPLIAIAESMDTRRAVDLYVRMLPMLQQSYEELGYPNQRFHTRFVNVIDQMLAAPTAPELLRVQLTEVQGPIPSERPWVRYEFADPALEKATSGQKLLMRMGASNERRVKARLAEFRRELVRRAVDR